MLGSRREEQKGDIPICDRSGRPDNKHEVFVDKGETSLSREIKEKSSHEELCSSDRSGQLDITPSVIRAQTNLSGEIRVEQTHDQAGQPDKHNVALRAAPEVHREITTLNTDNELTRERIEEDMDFKIPGLPHSTVKQLQSASVRQLIQKIENHPDRHALQKDLQENQSFYPFSPESKTNVFMKLGTSNYVNYSRRKPKRSAKYVYHTGILVYSTARAGTSCVKEEERIRNSSSIRWTFFQIPEFVIKKGRPHGHRYGKKPGDKEYHTANKLKKKCNTKYFQGIHDRFIRDPEFRNRMIENNRDEGVFAENGMLLRMKIIPTI